jgi:hypothetical protein
MADHANSCSGGTNHVLQFIYTQAMLVACLWLARDLGRPLGSARPLAVMAPGVRRTPPAVGTPDPRPGCAGLGGGTIAFTRLMQFGNALAVVPVGLVLAVALIRRGATPVEDAQRPQYRALAASLTLFGAGGVLAVAVSGGQYHPGLHDTGAGLALRARSRSGAKGRDRRRAPNPTPA